MLFLFFLSWVAKNQLSHWTRRVLGTRLFTWSPRNCPGPYFWREFHFVNLSKSNFCGAEPGLLRRRCRFILVLISSLDRDNSLVNLTSSSDETCHLRKKFTPAFWRIVSAATSEKIFTRFSRHFLGVLFYLKSVFPDGRDVKYDRDVNPHPHPFLRTNSHKADK